jgi:hypothetical protein
MSGKTFQKVNAALFWNPRFRQLGMEAQAVYLFLLINENLNMLGTRQATLVSLASDMGAEFERFQKAFTSLAEAGFIRYDHETMLLYLPGTLDQQKKSLNPNQVKSWLQLYTNLPPCGLRDELVIEMSKVFAELSEKTKKGIDAESLESLQKVFLNPSETLRKGFQHEDVDVDVNEKGDVDVDGESLSKNELSSSSEKKGKRNNAASADDGDFDYTNLGKDGGGMFG